MSKEFRDKVEEALRILVDTDSVGKITLPLTGFLYPSGQTMKAKDFYTHRSVTL